MDRVRCIACGQETDFSYRDSIDIRIRDAFSGDYLCPECASRRVKDAPKIKGIFKSRKGDKK